MRALSVTTLPPSSSTGTWAYPPVSAFHTGPCGPHPDAS